MVLHGTTRAIATEAWSQLVLSIISNSPPIDMSRNYYYTYPETGLNYLGKQLKRLERYKYKLGTKNIQTRMRYNMPSVQAIERENQQGIEYMRDCARSIKQSKIQQENEDEIHQGIEHIQESLRSCKHSQVAVQTNEDENQQGIEHIRESLRSSKHSKVLQENKEEYQQGIEHIQDCLISSKHYQVARAEKDEEHQGIDHIHDSLSLLVNSEFVVANEHENQQGVNHVLDSLRSNKQSEVVQEDEVKNLHGIENFQECPISSKVSKVVQTNKDGNQKRMEHIQDTLRLNTHSELEQANEHGKRNDLIRDSIKSTVSFKPPEFDDDELIKKYRRIAGSTDLPEDVHQRINYNEARKMSTLFDELLDLIENGDLLREEKPTLRFQVLKVIKLLHHYGVDTIRIGVENELEDVNLKSNQIEEDTAIHYKKKGLEKKGLLLRRKLELLVQFVVEHANAGCAQVPSLKTSSTRHFTLFIIQYVEKPSRRMCNLAYVTYVLAVNLQNNQYMVL
ncbi:hypothetical protein POM88_022212 [Heracleum sosnowskyi]|uniref:Uncharacterized protein n=1 Tax=Heracleum sosnowskyi TaxID=360622 RepID=A0AAD8IHF3_9APIA|nr:hypothetical protein POM88_022212 [Heracleum sosnowskyi]